MNNSELRSLNIDELKSKLVEERGNYQKLKFAHAITPVENPSKIRHSRRLIARIQTEIKAKELSK
ncbi:MAG: 50S ribosomal protein L29 [Bacteroidota bacterium]